MNCTGNGEETIRVVGLSISSPSQFRLEVGFRKLVSWEHLSPRQMIDGRATARRAREQVDYKGEIELLFIVKRLADQQANQPSKGDFLPLGFLI